MADTLVKIIRDACVALAVSYGRVLPTTGSTFFVDSGTGSDDADKGLAPDDPLATLDYAIGLCTASKGDMIVCMPGHAESLGVAGVDADVAGISIFGLGNGSNRPTFTFTGAAGADMDFDAANIAVFNCRFIGSEDGLTGPLDVNAAYCGVYSCVFQDDGAENVVDWITLDAAATAFECVDCENQGTDTAGNDSFLTVTGAAAHIKVIRLLSHGDFAVANIDLSGAAVTDCLVTECHLENANAVDVCIEGLAAMTGWISKNMCRIATDAQTTWINTPGNACLFENYGVNNNGETGKLIGTASV